MTRRFKIKQGIYSVIKIRDWGARPEQLITTNAQAETLFRTHAYADAQRPKFITRQNRLKRESRTQFGTYARRPAGHRSQLSMGKDGDGARLAVPGLACRR